MVCSLPEGVATYFKRSERQQLVKYLRSHWYMVMHLLSRAELRQTKTWSVFTLGQILICWDRPIVQLKRDHINKINTILPAWCAT